MKIRLMGAVLASAGLGLAACGGDDGGSDTTAAPVATSAAPASSAAGTADSEHNEADVTFAQGMIGHHQQAIEMSEIALDPTRAAGPEVMDLANRIKAAQGPEIDTLTAWLESWGEPVAMDVSGGHDMSTMEGMMTAEDMDALAALTAADFDREWMTMMIAHHEGAITQSETVKTDGMNTEVRILADQIITAQTAEITEMQGLLAG